MLQLSKKEKKTQELHFKEIPKHESVNVILLNLFWLLKKLQ